MVWLFLLRRSKLSLAQNVNNKINAISHISIYLFPFITFFYNLYLLFLQTTNCSEVLWSRLETWSGIKSLSRVRVTWARINCLVLAVIRVDQFSHQQLKKKKEVKHPLRILYENYITTTIIVNLINIGIVVCPLKWINSTKQSLKKWSKCVSQLIYRLKLNMFNF